MYKNVYSHYWGLAVIFALLFNSLGSSIADIYLPLVSTPQENEWAMVAANPQRTSWTPEEVSGNLNIEWYRPIEAYIPQNVQIIAGQGLLFISTARGVYALDAQNGTEVWRYDTELPVGNSPTLFGGVLYFGGYDKKIHALNANTGAHLWEYDGASAGFNANPLVIEGKVIVGNRDGYMYAVGAHNTSQQGQLIWRFKTNGPIHLSAAYKAGVIYFASNDNYAYALRVDDGSLVWKSQKLPGDGYQIYWPVIYQDKVVFSGSPSYRHNASPGVNNILDPEGNPFTAYDSIQRSDIFFDKSEGGTIGPLVTMDEPWTMGNEVVDASRISEYLEDNPDQDPYLHKPWRRIMIVLNLADGSEFTFDSDNDGFPEYTPVAYWGSRSGNAYPPIVGANNVIYFNNIYAAEGGGSAIPQGKLMGWKLGTPYFSLLRGHGGALDEPQAVSSGGQIIYRSICCDRLGSWAGISYTSNRGEFWNYTDRLFDQAPSYGVMFWGLTQPAGDPSKLGNYGGSGLEGSPHNGKNGIYQNHGVQNPFIPYKGRVYIHRSNAIIAYGPGTGPGKLPLLTINNVIDQVRIPSRDELVERLEVEIQKILLAGQLRPGYYNDGKAAILGLKNYYENPGDTLYTLSMVYPLVSPSLQLELKNYLKDYFQTYFDPVMYARTGWAEGVGRESMPLPPEIASSLTSYPKSTNVGPGLSWQYPQNNFYAMWKYAQIFPEDVVRVYDLAKSKLSVPVPSSATDEYLNERTWEFNAYIAGYFGFLNLQALSGMSEQDSQLRTAVQNELSRLLDLRSRTFSKDTPYTNCTDPAHPECLPGGGQNYNRAYNVSRNFIWLVPELAEYLATNAYSKVLDAYDDYNYVTPYWFVSRYEATAEEGMMLPLYDYNALFSAKAYILSEPREELIKYLDVPAFEIGDLLFIQNLVAIIESNSEHPLGGDESGIDIKIPRYPVLFCNAK